MRVGISLLTLAPSDLGGSETYARQLVRALSRVGSLEMAVIWLASETQPRVYPRSGQGIHP
jgi:hypothetical protein